MSRNNKTGPALPFSISQNYLTSAKTIRRLLRLTTLTGDDQVIEIGAGKGHITRELVKVCRRVVAYEIDGGLAGRLRLCPGPEGLDLRQGDFLRATLPRSEPYKVFSNIPFCITTQIVRKLAGADNPPQAAWLVMEKGAAKRFTGKPRETVASLALKPFFEVETVYYFSRQDFHPMPRVDVVLLQLLRKNPYDIPASQRGAFSRFVEDCLSRGPEHRLTKKQISTALRLAGLPPARPPEEMLYVQWLCLFRCYCKFSGASGRRL